MSSAAVVIGALRDPYLGTKKSVLVLFGSQFFFLFFFWLWFFSVFMVTYLRKKSGK